VTTALQRVDKLKSGRDKDAAAAVTEIDELVTELERDVGSATPGDATRLRALAATIKGRADSLR
jgi:hypothetical protein